MGEDTSIAFVYFQDADDRDAIMEDYALFSQEAEWKRNSESMVAGLTLDDDVTPEKEKAKQKKRNQRKQDRRMPKPGKHKEPKQSKRSTRRVSFHDQNIESWTTVEVKTFIES